VVVCVHAIATALVHVLDERQAERAAAILIALELVDRSVGRVGGIEPDNTAALRPAAWLVLDLGLLDLADGSEEFN